MFMDLRLIFFSKISKVIDDIYYNKVTNIQ